MSAAAALLAACIFMATSATAHAATMPATVSVNDSVVGTTSGTFAYGGKWKVSTGSAKFGGDDHYSGSTGDTYTFRMTGTQVELFAAKASHHGRATVSVDGGAAVTIDLYSSTRVENTSVFRSATLPYGDHTVVVRVAGTKHSSSKGYVVTVDRAVVTTGTRTVANDSVVGTTSGTFEYGAGWTVSTGSPSKYDGDDHYSATTGATFTYRFRGNQLELFATKAPHHGQATVSIDGGSAVTIDQYASVRADQASVYRSPLLAEGDHVAVVTVTGTHNPSSSGTTISIDRADHTSDSTAVTAPATTEPAPAPSTRIVTNDSVLGTTSGTFDYGSGWSVSTGSTGKYNGDDHYSATTGATFRYRFRGNQLELFATKAPHHGQATVSIDGGSAVAIDQYASVRTDQVLVYRSPLLPEGDHVAVVTVRGTRNVSSSGYTVAIDRADHTSDGTTTSAPAPTPTVTSPLEVDEQWNGSSEITTSTSPWTLEWSGLNKGVISNGTMKIPAYDQYHRIYYTPKRMGGPGKPLVIKMRKRLTRSQTTTVNGTNPGANIWFRVPGDGVDKENWRNAITGSGVSSMIVRDGIGLNGRMEVARYDGEVGAYIFPWVATKNIGYTVGTWKYVTHRYDWVSTDKWRVRIWHGTTGDPSMEDAPVYDITFSTTHMNEKGFIAFRTDFVDAELDYITIDEL